MATRVGIDTGGTFTDLVASDASGAFRVAKTLSTPQRPSQSTADAIRKAGLSEEGGIETLVHGTTIATNALIERRGATVGVLTTAGFRDILQIQRVIRPRSFDLDWVRPAPLVPRRLVREVSERVNADGEMRQPLDEESVRAAADALIADGAEALAISFLFSFVNPAHEARARDIVCEAYPGVPVSISSEVFGQWREYERTSTCVIDAFLKPTVARYADELRELASTERIADLLVMRSNGGAQTPEGAKAKPVSMVRSGPAGGVIASVHVGEATGNRNLLIADMGGTSFDTGLIHEGQPSLTTKAELEWGIPIAVPMVDVRSVGAGGGSIGWIDAAGILRVGPQSAGSVPGPACYGRGGTEPTITDANLVLGRLSDDLLLAGDVKLDRPGAEAALGRLAEQMGRSVEDVALGMVQIADNNMAQALRLVSIDCGHDPRDFALIAFGGAGPLHASSLARALAIRRVIVPVFPGAFSAFGALIADTRFDYMKTFITGGRTAAEIDRILAIYEELEHQATDDMAREGISIELEIERSIEMRYAGQNWELDVALEGAPSPEVIALAKERFHREHQAQFGWNLPDGGLELVNFKLVATASRPKPEIAPLEPGPLPSPVVRRQVTFQGLGAVASPVYWRDDLPAEASIAGPAIVAETNCTVLVQPGDTLEVNPAGHLTIRVGEETA